MFNSSTLNILIFGLSNLIPIFLPQNITMAAEKSFIDRNPHLSSSLIIDSTDENIKFLEKNLDSLNVNKSHSSFFAHNSFLWAKQPEKQLFFSTSAKETGKSPSSSNQDDFSENGNVAPELRSNPNPLELPTTPEEVEIQSIIPLTLEDSIALAMANSRELKIAKINVEKSQAVLDESRAEMFPTLSLGAGVTRNLDANGDLPSEVSRISTQNNISDLENSIPVLENQISLISDELNKPFDPNNPLEVQERIYLSIQAVNLQQDLESAKSSLNSNRESLKNIKNYASTFIDGTVSLNYAIYSPSRQARIDFASEQLFISDLDVNRIKNEIVLNVSLAYYDLQQADQQVKINENDVLDRSKRLESLELLLEAALTTRLDLLNAQVELGNSLQNLKNSQTQQKTSQRELARLLVLPPSVTPVTADPIEIAGNWAPSLEASIIMALKNRVELQQQLAQRKSSLAQRKIALAAIRPTLSLFAQYQLLQGYSDDPNINDLVAGNFATGYSFGLQFNWNFFDGGAASAGARQAEADLAISEQRYGEEADSIRFEVEQSYLQLPAQLENIKTAQQAVERATEAVRAAQIRFSASVNTQTEVLDAQTRLVQAQNNLLNAVLGYNRALAELQRAVKN